MLAIKRSVLASACALALLGGQMDAAGNGQAWRLVRTERTADVNDPVTGQPTRIRIMHMLLPPDWRLNVGMAQGGTIDCANNVGRLSVTATTPDLKMGVMVFPMSASVWSDNPTVLHNITGFFRQWKAFNCVSERPMSMQQGLSMVAPRIIDGAKLQGGVQPIPGLSENLPQTVAAANQQLAGQAQLEAEAGRLRVTGTLQGRPVEAWLVALQTRRTEMAQGGGKLTVTDLPLFATVFAPVGQLDSNEKLLMTILSSIEVDPQHLAAMQRHVMNIWQTINGGYAQVARIQQQMAADNARALQQQAAIRADAANYASSVRSNVARDRAAALDHSSQQFALYMGDQAVYRDPTTGQHVQMSSGYNHVWASSTGNNNEYVLTDSPSFNPNGQVGSGSWVQMQEVR